MTEMNPTGVSVAQVVCPACGETVKFTVLFESATQPATIYGTVDIAPVREHVKRMHPEVADEDETA
jgi:hypothetical protein